jgi:hypothetical protein
MDLLKLNDYEETVKYQGWQSDWLKIFKLARLGIEYKTRINESSWKKDLKKESEQLIGTKLRMAFICGAIYGRKFALKEMKSKPQHRSP